MDGEQFGGLKLTAEIAHEVILQAKSSTRESRPLGIEKVALRKHAKLTILE